MIGGEEPIVRHLDPIFATLAPGIGDIPAHRQVEKNLEALPSRDISIADPAGAGHFVKMVHNGIEYGLMAAYAEGLSVS